MGATKAQKTPAGRRRYGKNYQQGREAEKAAAARLRRQGYSAKLSPGSKGRADVTATKNGRTKKIQVKKITSRTFATVTAARNRMRGKPYNVPPGTKVELTDGAGHIWRFTV